MNFLDDDNPDEMRPCQGCGRMSCVNDLHKVCAVFNCLDKDVQNTVLAVIQEHIKRSGTTPLRTRDITNDNTGSKIRIESFMFCEACWFDFINVTCMSIMCPERLEDYANDDFDSPAGL